MQKLPHNLIQREKRWGEGKQALIGMFLEQTKMVAGKYISEHDLKIANKLLAYVVVLRRFIV
jgi:hypothetical protein